MYNLFCLALVLATPSCAFVNTLKATPAFTRTTDAVAFHLNTELSAVNQEVSRGDFLNGAKALAIGAFASIASSTSIPGLAVADDSETTVLPSGVAYKVSKAGDGPQPEVGELVAVRFKAYAGSNVIDDIFDTPEPYYTRVGAGGLLKGVEEVIPKMRVGDRWLLNIPSSLAFGAKGRPASAGKPRIPANTDIVFDIEMVGLPGREPELIELIGDV